MKIRYKDICAAREIRQWIMLGATLKLAFPDADKKIAYEWNKIKFRVKNGKSFEEYLREQNRVLH